MNRPPPPKVPPPGEILTEEEENAIPPGSMVDLTHDILENTLGFPVINIHLYRTAFMHEAAAALVDGCESYQRLEFLGDSILNFVTAKYLFDKYVHEPEGFLTVMRTRLTRSETLATFARKLDLGRFVFLPGKGLYREWYNSPRILEDVYESLVGAIYMDLGLNSAKLFIYSTYNLYVDWSDMHKDRNYKDQLMRVCHSRSHPLPTYVSDEDRERRVFKVTVTIDSSNYGYGEHRTKKGAEQIAARETLRMLHVPIDV